MFNNTNNLNKTIVSTHVNAVSGNITKTYKESWFKTVDMDSKIFSKEPRLNMGSYYNENYKEVVIIQAILCGDNKVIAELMLKEDYDNMLINI